jgi:hypothetical protein
VEDEGDELGVIKAALELSATESTVEELAVLLELATVEVDELLLVVVAFPVQATRNAVLRKMTVARPISLINFVSLCIIFSPLFDEISIGLET